MSARPKVIYEHSRLCFLEAMIEPLRSDESFRIQAKCGTFQMTKAEFQRVFSNVAANEKSYRIGGIYHYPRPPRKADQFRID